MLGGATIYATIAVRDMQRSKEFYEQKLGLTQVDENAGGVMYESGSGRVFVYQSETAGSGRATCAAWEVNDIEQAVSDLRSAGVEFDTYDIPGAEVQDGIYTMEGQRVAWFKDPDGNILSVGS